MTPVNNINNAQNKVTGKKRTHVKCGKRDTLKTVVAIVATTTNPGTGPGFCSSVQFNFNAQSRSATDKGPRR